MVQAADVIVVGAGFGGASVAHVCAAAGLTTLLVDPRDRCPPCFKAEKLEADQAELLRGLGLFEVVRPHLTPIPYVLCGRKGTYFGLEETEQYGFDYADVVNGLRETLPASVTPVRDLVVDVAPSHVTLKSGRTLTANVVVLATGVTEAIARRLELARDVISPEHSMAFAFDAGPREAFPFASLTYYPRARLSGIACLTLFPIDATMRANLFVYRAPRDPWVQAFLEAPAAVLARDLPGLDKLAGRIAIGKVSSARIRLYRTQPPAGSGPVLLGDAVQSACPATGTGLTKVLTDVDVLRSHLARGLDAHAYHTDPRRVATDERCLQSALYSRHLATERSLRWDLAAATGYWRRRLKQRARLRAHLRVS